MIEELEEKYEKYVRNILNECPILYVRQIMNALQKTYPECNDRLCAEILKALQRKGRLYLTYDGFVITRGAYLDMTGDKKYDYVDKNGPVRVPEEMSVIKFEANKVRTVIKRGGVLDLMPRGYKDVLDAMWIVIDKMPNITELTRSNSPWIYSFIVGVEGKDELLYQVTKFTKKNESLKAEMIKSLPKIKNEAARNSIRRIAIIENESHAWAVPYLGFKYICVIDDTVPAHFRVVEDGLRKNEELWKDYVE